MTEPFPWRSLKPLEECEVAAMTLVNLGVRASFWTGWAQIGLSVASIVFAARPGASIALKSKFASLRVSYSGGASYQPYLSFGDELTIIADGLASVTCEVCGRPGAYRSGPIGVFCETDFLLRMGVEPVRPQMPYLAEIPAASAELRNRKLAVPTGWSQIAFEIIRARERSDLPTGVAFVDAGTHLELVGDHRDEHFRRLQNEIRESSPVTCRRCGRELDDGTPANGVCAGCLWLDTRGFEIVPGFEL